MTVNSGGLDHVYLECSVHKLNLCGIHGTRRMLLDIDRMFSRLLISIFFRSCRHNTMVVMSCLANLNHTIEPLNDGIQ